MSCQKQSKCKREQTKVMSPQEIHNYKLETIFEIQQIYAQVSQFISTHWPNHFLLKQLLQKLHNIALQDFQDIQFILVDQLAVPFLKQLKNRMTQKMFVSLLKELSIRIFKKNQYLISLKNQIYLHLLQGKVKINENPQSKVKFFSHQLLKSQPEVNQYSIVTLQDSIFLSFKGKSFNKLIQRTLIQQYQMIIEYFRNFQFMRSLSNQKLRRIVNFAQLRYYKRGNRLEQLNDNVYFIIEGQIVVKIVNLHRGKRTQMIISQLGKNQIVSIEQINFRERINLQVKSESLKLVSISFRSLASEIPQIHQIFKNKYNTIKLNYRKQAIQRLTSLEEIKKNFCFPQIVHSPAKRSLFSKPQIQEFQPSPIMRLNIKKKETPAKKVQKRQRKFKIRVPQHDTIDRIIKSLDISATELQTIMTY